MCNYSIYSVVMIYKIPLIDQITKKQKVPVSVGIKINIDCFCCR